MKAFAAVVLSLVVARSAAAGDRPSDLTLVAAGAAMAAPTYLLFVALHEGSHAAVAHTFGAQVTAMHLLPGQHDGHFFFGYTEWRGAMTPGRLSLTLLAPKATDGIVMVAYAALVAAGGLPSNAYGSMALTVLATGAWVDFTKDVIAFGPMNDVIRVHALAGRTAERQRWPWRVLHAAVAASAAVPIYVGYRHTFRRPVWMMPLASGQF